MIEKKLNEKITLDLMDKYDKITAIGSNGMEYIIYLESEKLDSDNLPIEIDGYLVKYVVSGKILPL